MNDQIKQRYLSSKEAREIALNIMRQAAQRREARIAAEAAAELTEITPRNSDLLKIADCFPAPQEWYDE